MIIYCPSCLTEILLTKTSECAFGWRCDKCNVCCLNKEGIPFLNEPKVEEEELTPEEHKFYEKVFAPSKEIKKDERRRQMTIFDFLKQ